MYFVSGLIENRFMNAAFKTAHLEPILSAGRWHVSIGKAGGNMASPICIPCYAHVVVKRTACLYFLALLL